MTAQRVVPLRPCWVCGHVFPNGRCPRHPTTAYQYRPNRASVLAGAYSGDWPALRAIVLARDGRICRYCGVLADTADHVVPRSRGGLTQLDNLVACCAPCNRSKKDRTLAQWVASGAAPTRARALLEDRRSR